tara:strand:+ start:683 stop:1597 length:915 start_codon:yes stop_codon:yes gene_type:complete
MDFKFPIYIPSLDRFVNFREILNKYYKAILKYLENKDNINLEIYFNGLIDTLNDDGIVHTDLNKIDRFCILLMLRAVSIGPELKLTLTCQKTQEQYKGAIDLNHILNLTSNLNQLKQKRIKINKNVSVKINTPQVLHCDSDNILEMVTDTVSEVTINKKKYTLGGMSLHEKNIIVNNLPGFTFNKIFEFANRYHENFNDLIIFTDKSPHDQDAEVNEYKLNLYDNSMFDFLKICYSASLDQYYRLMYTLCDTMKFSAEYIDNITPIESNIYVAYKVAEVDKQKKAAKSSEGPMLGGIPQPGGLE